MGNGFAELLGQGFDAEFHHVLLFATHGDEHGVAVGGMAAGLADGEFLGGEAFEVVVAGELDAGALGREGLHDNLAGHFTAARASGDLGEELEGAFASAEIGNVEGEVGVEDADKGDVGEMEALGDHLGADEQIDLLSFKGIEGIAQFVLAGHGVGIDAGDAGGGELFAERFLNAFGAESGMEDAGVIASRAGAGGFFAVAADVADHDFFTLVKAQGGAAMLALDDVAAALADEAFGITAAVEKEDGLLSIGEPTVDGDAEFLADDGGRVALATFAALQFHVDDPHEWQRAVIGSLFHLHEIVFATLHIVEGFETRGRAAEHDGAAFQLGADDGDVSSLVARGLVLLVGILMLFIDKNQAQIFQRREDGAAGTDDNAALAAGNFMPFVEAFAL